MRIPVAFALLALAALPAGAAPPLQAAHARPLTDIVFERTPERVERGRYLANAVIGCVLCHSPRDFSQPGAPPIPGREFSGAVIAEEEGYRLVAANLTPDVETGAGAWPDDALARAIREGVGHDGRGIGGGMWWWAFRELADEDVRSIVVYLRSLPPVRNALPERLLSAELEAERAAAARPLTTPVPAPTAASAEERGAYLIAVADCMGCHTAWGKVYAFGGGNPIEYHGRRAWSANLTPDPSATGGWSEEIFVARMRSGRAGALDPIMPWAAYRGMTDDDLRAIFAALRTAPPVRHWVNNVDPPTACAVCGGEHGLGAMNAAPALIRAAADLGPLEAYVGRYELAAYAVSLEITARDGALYASEGGPPIELVPGEDGRLHGIGLPSPVTFERDASGAVVAMLSYELGTSRWERVRP
jgi:mono/diheme cytochrome c family protein